MSIETELETIREGAREMAKESARQLQELMTCRRDKETIKDNLKNATALLGRHRKYMEQFVKDYCHAIGEAKAREICEEFSIIVEVLDGPGY
jgi:Mg2+ and Co2+ transporter CorA